MVGSLIFHWGGGGIVGDSALQPAVQHHPLTSFQIKDLLFNSVTCLAQDLCASEGDGMLTALIQEEIPGKTRLACRLDNAAKALEPAVAAQRAAIQAAFVACLHAPLLAAALTGRFKPMTNANDHVITHLLGTGDAAVWRITSDIASLFDEQAPDVVSRLDQLRQFCLVTNPMTANS